VLRQSRVAAPVKNLTFSAEVFYTHLDQMFAGTAVLAPSAPKPTTRYEFRDQDTISLNIRAQRNFLSRSGARVRRHPPDLSAKAANHLASR